METLSQAGAIPYRRCGRSFQLLLVTSRGGNWIFPKGIVEPGKTPQETALKECHEEAGVRGHLHPVSVGSYHTRKWKRDCEVHLYLLRWEEDVEPWEEGDIRERSWCSFEEAHERLKRDELRRVLDAARERLPRLEGSLVPEG